MAATRIQSGDDLSPWWKIASIVTMAFGFGVLILLTIKAYQDAPPIPAQVAQLHDQHPGDERHRHDVGADHGWAGDDDAVDQPQALAGDHHQIHGEGDVVRRAAPADSQGLRQEAEGRQNCRDETERFKRQGSGLHVGVRRFSGEGS